MNLFELTTALRRIPPMSISRRAATPTSIPRLAVFAVLFFMIGCRSSAPAVQQIYDGEEYLSREGHLGNDTFKYRVYVPKGRDAGRRLPVMLYLHGAGNRGRDNQGQLNGLADIIEANRDKFSFIVVVPQCPEDSFWNAQLLERANKALDDTVGEFHGDPQRLYLAGFSLGGFGVWTMAAMFPDKFAAIIPLSGRVFSRDSELKLQAPKVGELSKAADPYRAMADQIGSTAVWIFHGGKDSVVAVDYSRKMADALKTAGNTKVKYTEVADAGHEPLGLRENELFQWLSDQKRSER